MQSMLPTAYVVLWLLAALLSVWGITLIVRGARHRRRPIAFDDVDKHQLLRTPGWLYIGVAAQGVSLALYVAGSKARAWARGELGDSIDWLDGSLTVAIGGGVLLAGVALLLRGILYDPARGRQRCPRCWYDMQSLAASGRLVCPECGHDAKHSRRLARTRHHRLSLAAGIAIMLAAWFAPRALLVPKYGYKTLVPTTVMIAGMWCWEDEWIRGPVLPVKYSLEWRLDTERSWAWQRRWTLQRCEHMLDDPDPLACYFRAVMIQESIEEWHAFFPVGACVKAAKQLASADRTAQLTAVDVLDHAYPLQFDYPPWPWNKTLASELRDATDDLLGVMRRGDPLTASYAAWLLAYSGAHRAEAAEFILANQSLISSETEAFRATSVLGWSGRSDEAVMASLEFLTRSNWNWAAMDGLTFAATAERLPQTIEDQLEHRVLNEKGSTWPGKLAEALVQSKIHAADSVNWLVVHAKDADSPLQALAYEALASEVEENPERAEARWLIGQSLNSMKDNPPRMNPLFMYPRDRIFQATLIWIKDLADRDIEQAADYMPVLQRMEQGGSASLVEAVTTTITAIDHMLGRLKARNQSR